MSDSFTVYRARDLVGAGVGLVFLLPVLILTSVAIKLDSRGPVFFRQERVGKNGDLFSIHKFRSMRTDMPGLQISSAVDPRITRVGRIIRRTKIDELPQLIDVLTGDMSLVGPRPEVPKYVNLWAPNDRKRILSVPPGITDPASLAFRHEDELLQASVNPEQLYVDFILPQKVTLYLEYVRRKSFLQDLAILGKTFLALFSTPSND